MVAIAVATLFAATFSVRGALVQVLHRSARLRLAQSDLQAVLVDRSDEAAGAFALAASKRPREISRLLQSSARLRSSVSDLTAALTSLEMPRSAAAARALTADIDRWDAIARRGTISRSDAQLEALLRRRIYEDAREIENRLNADSVAAERRTEHDANRTISLAMLASVLVIGFAMVAIRQRAERAAEKNVTDALRRAFDPTNLPELDSIRISATSLPAARDAQVGGDWCDAYVLPNGRIFFSIGDVAGHGLGAAVGMSRARQSLLAASLSEREPSAVLSAVNAVIHVQGASLVTAICGFVDPDLRMVVYACAGHPPPIVVDGSGARLLPYGDVPLGIDTTSNFTTQSLPVGDGTVLVFYSDGIIEHGRDAVAGEQRLLGAAQALTRMRPGASADELISRLIPGKGPSDDASVMLITFFSNQDVDQQQGSVLPDRQSNVRA